MLKKFMHLRKTEITRLFTISCLLCMLSLPAQEEANRTSRIGVMGSLDYAFNFGDKVLGPSMNHKWSVALSYTNKKRQFLAFAGVGIKGFKLSISSPSFKNAFISDIQQHYVPVSGGGEDSLVAAKMNGKPGDSFWDSYSQYFQAGFMLNASWKPTILFYMGNEKFLLFDESFRKYEDPKYGDIKYVSMPTWFYELKAGCTLPITAFSKKSLNLLLTVGYKWVNYGFLKMGPAPLAEYTNGDLTKKYNKSGKLTISLTFMAWSNWK